MPSVAFARILAVMAILMFFATPLWALDTYQGKVALAGDGRLTIVGKDGDNTEFFVVQDTKITLDGKKAKLDDLDTGDIVTVTASLNDAKKLVASMIDGKSAE
jgi:hypothetical protein